MYPENELYLKDHPKRFTLQPSGGQTLISMIQSGQQCSNTALHKVELKNEQESMSQTDFNCKQVKEQPADPETHEICHVTKFGNWEFEGLEAFVRGVMEPRLTGHYEETL